MVSSHLFTAFCYRSKTENRQTRSADDADFADLDLQKSASSAKSADLSSLFVGLTKETAQSADGGKAEGHSDWDDRKDPHNNVIAAGSHFFTRTGATGEGFGSPVRVPFDSRHKAGKFPRSTSDTQIRVVLGYRHQVPKTLASQSPKQWYPAPFHSFRRRFAVAKVCRFVQTT